MKKSSKRGFTLIELLAVIVILAIIALIAVPIILNMINQARKSAARSSALGYIDSIEYYNGFAQISDDAGLDYNVPLPTMTNGSVTCTKTASGWNNGCSEFFAAVDKKAKGDKPKTATIIISESGKVLDGTTMKYGKYDVAYDGKDATIGGESNNGETQTDVVYKYTYYDLEHNVEASIESTDLNPSFDVYVRENLSTHVKEVCANLSNGTICFNNSNYDWSCDSNGNNCLVNTSGNKSLELKSNFESVTKCNDVTISSDGIYLNTRGFSCSFNEEVYCNAHAYGRVSCGNDQTFVSCSINADGTSLCEMI